MTSVGDLSGSIPFSPTTGQVYWGQRRRGPDRTGGHPGIRKHVRHRRGGQCPGHAVGIVPGPNRCPRSFQGTTAPRFLCCDVWFRPAHCTADTRFVGTCDSDSGGPWRRVPPARPPACPTLVPPRRRTCRSPLSSRRNSKTYGKNCRMLAFCFDTWLVFTAGGPGLHAHKRWRMAAEEGPAGRVFGSRCSLVVPHNNSVHSVVVKRPSFWPSQVIRAVGRVESSAVRTSAASAHEKHGQHTPAIPALTQRAAVVTPR